MDFYTPLPDEWIGDFIERVKFSLAESEKYSATCGFAGKEFKITIYTDVEDFLTIYYLNDCIERKKEYEEQTTARDYRALARGWN